MMVAGEVSIPFGGRIIALVLVSSLGHGLLDYEVLACLGLLETDTDYGL